MISPTVRLIAAAAIVMVPVCTWAGLSAEARLPCVLFLLACFAIAVVDAIRSRRTLAEIAVEADGTLTWFQGRESGLPIRVKPSARINLEMPPGIEILEDRHEDRQEIVCLPKERGRFSVKTCHIASVSPWRLWRIRGEKAVNVEIRVFPDLQRERGAKMLLLKKLGGLRTHRMLGRGREFERLRDYVHGDAFDEICWKATARRGRPIVSVFQVERTQDVYVVLDCSRLAAKHGLVDRSVNAALMVALAAENQGDRFGLVAFSDRVDRFVPAARGIGHFSRCRDAVYELQARKVSPDFAELIAFLQLRIRKRSLLLFLTDLGDPLLAELFLRPARMLARRHLVLISRFADEQARPLFSGAAPENTDEIYSRLAGHLQWAAIEELQKDLQRIGIGVHVIGRESAGLDLVQQYAEVKRRQAL
ncbi:MAG TPA: DUF58 domain-containing protein [Bryobacteraceae bacterium]